MNEHFSYRWKGTRDLNNNKVEIHVANDSMTSWQLYLIGRNQAMKNYYTPIRLK